MPRRQRIELNKEFKRRLIVSLRELYGDKCCYCAGLMCFEVNRRNMNNPDVRSIEHIVDYSKKKTNSDTIQNALLSHRQCNSLVGAAMLSIEDKEYYIANPHHFIEDFLDGKQVQFNKHTQGNRSR